MEEQDNKDKEQEGQNFGGDMEIEVKQEQNNLSQDKEKGVDPDFQMEEIEYDFEKIRLLQSK